MRTGSQSHAGSSLGACREGGREEGRRGGTKGRREGVPILDGVQGPPLKEG